MELVRGTHSFPTVGLEVHPPMRPLGAVEGLGGQVRVVEVAEVELPAAAVEMGVAGLLSSLAGSIYK